MKGLSIFSLFLFSVQSNNVSAFSVRDSSSPVNHRVQQDNKVSRRSFVALIPAVAGLSIATDSANASGGATAGGAYLLSAKQRYNERVKNSVQALLSVCESLSAGDSKPAKVYFTNEDAGSYKDLTAAGYLLSNAFRRNSSSAPDSLPAVKKYKAFAKEVEELQKVLKKKGAGAASEKLPVVLDALDLWLAEIELPPAKEL